MTAQLKDEITFQMHLLAYTPIFLHPWKLKPLSFMCVPPSWLSPPTTIEKQVTSLSVPSCSSLMLRGYNPCLPPLFESQTWSQLRKYRTSVNVKRKMSAFTWGNYCKCLIVDKVWQLETLLLCCSPVHKSVILPFGLPLVHCTISPLLTTHYILFFSCFKK